MVLWKKESTKKDACYIDLLFKRTTDDFAYQVMKMTCIDKNKKCDVKSTELRMKGNQQFRAKNWRDAMELYNQSLRHATNASENISLAYANRSSCFLQMKKYDQCLADIELARAANYPERLMYKLDERQAACLKLMNDEPTKPEEKAKLALSFDANAKFPCLASAIKVQYNEKLGSHTIVATRDIDVGQIVTVEELFVSSTHCETQAFCKTCLRSVMNFIPCGNCNEFIFCGTHCLESNGLHKMSCNPLHHQNEYDSVRVVESVLLAVTAFPSVGSLMEFVERALSTRNFDVPACDSDIQSKYRMFLKLKLKLITSTQQLTEKAKGIIFWTYHMLLEIPEIKRHIHSKREKRFLMHLILQHHLILINNGTLFHQVDEDGKKTYEVSGIGLFESLIGHACFANTTYQRHGNQIFAYALRPIQKGEPLTIENFKARPAGRCKCSKCTPKWEQAVVDRFESEPDNLSLSDFHTDHFKELESRRILMNKMENLLRKYGRFPWMPEFECMTLMYDHAVHAEYAI